MYINTRYGTQVTYVGTNIVLNKKKNVSPSASTEEKKNMEQVDNKNTDIWQELKKKYNIRNASFDELCNISTKLYQAGQISLFDHAMLTFDPSKFPQPIKPNLFVTVADADGKRDWIAEYEARAAKDLKMGNMMSYRVNKNIQKIIERLQ